MALGHRVSAELCASGQLNRPGTQGHTLQETLALLRTPSELKWILLQFLVKPVGLSALKPALLEGSQAPVVVGGALV